MRLAFIPFALLIIPIMEIAVFIVVGNQIGLWPTLGMIVVTAFLGTLLLRHQGFQLLSEIRTKTDAGEIPGRALVHGVMLLIAGILLLTPGFVTDTCGFLLFFPPIRDTIWRFFNNNMNFEVLTPKTPHQATGDERRGPTIDLDATEFGPTDPNSPWNKK
ncbi:MAG: FxsA family protein [Hyphomicrobiales bacterium]